MLYSTRPKSRDGSTPNASATAPGTERHRGLALDAPDRLHGDAGRAGEVLASHPLLFAQVPNPLTVHHHVHASPPHLANRPIAWKLRPGGPRGRLTAIEAGA